MKVMILMIGICALIASISITYVVATQDHSAIHEIESLICWLVAVCGLGFGVVIERLEKR